MNSYHLNCIQQKLLHRNLVSIQGARCAAVLRSKNFPTNAFVAAHICQTSLEQNPSECPPEIFVKNCIDNRIQCRIHISQPECRRECERRHVKGQSQNVHEEKRKPTGYKRTHYESQYKSGSLLFLPRYSAFFPFGVSRFLNSRHYVFHYHFFTRRSWDFFILSSCTFGVFAATEDWFTES